MLKLASYNPNKLIWSQATAPALNAYFAQYPPETLLQSALSMLGDDIVLATGFGTSGIVLMHMAAQICPDTTIFYLQTDLFFPETLALRDQLAEQLGLTFVEVHSGLTLDQQAEQEGVDLWQHNPNRCCYLRKVAPLRRYLADKRAWITGVRRDQSSTRANAPLVMWDHANRLLKLNPLATWTQKDVWRYIYAHRLPYNQLHDQGYPSVGCWPCTQTVAAGEDQRSGRWAGQNKIECGIHLLHSQGSAI
jgi:phosphoadenosine phosphosulfate reductase